MLHHHDPASEGLTLTDRRDLRHKVHPHSLAGCAAGAFPHPGQLSPTIPSQLSRDIDISDQLNARIRLPHPSLGGGNGA